MIDITPENFIEYLSNPGKISAAYSAFHNYSVLNQWLAMSQVLQYWPLNTFKWWQRLWRRIKKWEKAIALIMPVTKKEKDEKWDDKVVSRFFICKRNWFTIHQTEGDDVIIADPPGFDFSLIDEKLWVTREEFSGMSWNCQWYAYNTTYAINPVGFNKDKTRFHELAHILLGHTDRKIIDTDTLEKDEKEFEAESVALICAATIWQTEEQLTYSLWYIQNWGIPKNLDKKRIEKLFSVANKILQAAKI